MRVTFDPAASDELDGIFAWIAKDSPRAAFEMLARIEAKVMRLETPALTHMGRPGLVEGTRELVEWPYIIVYKVFEKRDEIVIVSVVFGIQTTSSRYSPRIMGIFTRNPLNALLRRGPLAFYGRVSYGLYMTHIMVFIYFGWFDRRMDANGIAGNLAVVAFRLVAATAVATALWYGFESRILKLKRYFETRTPQKMSAGH